MLSKPLFLKTLIISSAFSKALYPSFKSFSLEKGFNPLLFLPHHHPFSSLQLPKKDDLALLHGLTKEQLISANETINQYSTSSQDLKLEEIQSITSLLRKFAHPLIEQIDLKEDLSEVNENIRVHKLLNLVEGYDIANNHFRKASLCLQSQDETTDIGYHLDEADRICSDLEEIEYEPELVKGLMVQISLIRGQFHKRKNENEQALELFHEALEKPQDDDAWDFVLPDYLVHGYREIGEIYALRKDLDKAVQFWTKGLEEAAQTPKDYLHKNILLSLGYDAIFLYCNLAVLLFQNQKPQEALQFLNKGLQVALKIYSPFNPDQSLKRKNFEFL